MGGRLSAHSAKDGFLFIKGEEYDLDLNVQKGGLEMTLEFGLDKQYVNQHPMPMPKVEKSDMKFEHNLIDVSLNSNDLGPKLLNGAIHDFKDLFLFALTPILNNGGFPLLANIEIGNIINQSKGQISMGPIQMLLSLLPTNNI